MVLVMSIGCGWSSGPTAGPVDVGGPSFATPQVSHAGTGNRVLWGLWKISVSEDLSRVDVVADRSAAMHLNVVKLLEVKPCSSCLTISNLQITGPNELSADLTLTHPFPGLLKYTGFDVRGIFISTADFTFPVSGRQIALGDTVPRMLDPDGYTPLFNPTEFPPTTPAALGYIPGKHSTDGDLSSTLNPFVAYRKDAPRRMFEAGGSETKTVKIYAPTGPIHFGYAVDVCWMPLDQVIDPLSDFPLSANCLEPYRMDVSIGAGLLSEMGSQVPIQVEIYDHQGQETISTVTMEAPDLFSSEISLAFSTVTPNDAFLFTGTLPNDLGAADGEYPLLVKATDWGSDQNLGEVAAWQGTLASVSPPKGWARTWGGTQDDVGSAVATDASGNLYVAGAFQDTVDFDPGAGVDNHTSIGYVDAFLSKFDPNGNFIWARTWGASVANSLAVDNSGNVYVTGKFGYTVDFDPGAGVDNHTSNAGYDVFLSRFDQDGNFIWARTWGGSEDDFGLSVATDGSGNVCVAGAVWGKVDFDPGPGVDNHPGHGQWDAFLSKFDPNGDYIWARTWGGWAWEEGYSVAIDNSGNPYVAGYFSEIFGNPVDFDPGPGVDEHGSAGGDEAFLSKFDPDGNFVWARTWGGTYDDRGNSVAIDGSGNAYVAGQFAYVVDFDPGTGVDNHTSIGYVDAFLSKFDPNGNFIWARTWGGPDGYYDAGDSGFSAAIDNSGNAYVAGRFYGPADFDPGAGVDNHTSYGGCMNAFLSKFDPDGNFFWARTWGEPGCDEGFSVAIDGSGNTFVSGGFNSTADFDPGPGVDNHTSNGSIDAFLSKFPPDGNW
jgi:hypothetical protein